MTRGLNFAGAELRPELFSELLSGPSTYRLGYQKARLCPNKGRRGGHEPDCPVCQGIGYYWEHIGGEETHEQELTRAGLYPESERLLKPAQRVTGITDEDGITYPPESVTVAEDGRVTWKEGAQRPADYRLYTVTYAAPSLIRGLIQGVTTQREFATRGEYEVMDVQLTVDRFTDARQTALNPAWDAGEHDRFTLLDTWRRHTQHIERGADLALYRHLKDVRLTSVVNGKLRDWEAGADFTVEDGEIKWASGRGPARGTFYTLEAQASPEYYVFQVLPQTRHMDGKPMPRRFVLRGFEQHPSERPED